MDIFIKGKFPSLNEVNNANRYNRYAGAKLKKETEYAIMLQLSQHKDKFEYAHIDFIWYEQNRKRDPDNLASAKKFILDCLVKNGNIPNDGWKNIAGFTDTWVIGENGVNIIIKEV